MPLGPEIQSLMMRNRHFCTTAPNSDSKEGQKSDGGKSDQSSDGGKYDQSSDAGKAVRGGVIR